MHPLLFGVDVSTSAAPDADPVAAARAAELLGFDFVSASDHPSGTHPTYETWTLLAWLAASTTRIGIASRVLSLPFRAPALVAKMAESLDRLSGGRLLLGLGAGAADDELSGFGLPVPSAREKIDGMNDALQLMRGLWSEPGFSYVGKVHHTAAGQIAPRAERPIPIWLGSFGDRALEVTGRQADGWIPSLGYVSRDQLLLMRSKIRSASEIAGRDPDAVRCVLNVHVDVHAGDASADPDLIDGPAKVVAARLAEFVADGFTGFNFMLPKASAGEQMTRLAGDVIPELRSTSRR